MRILEAKHCIAELFNADPFKLNDIKQIEESLKQAAVSANATLLKIKTHAFEPQGVTGFALLAESHISIHTWPELGFASVDAFTCGETTEPEKACLYLAHSLSASSYYLSSIERFSPSMLSKSVV